MQPAPLDNCIIQADLVLPDKILSNGYVTVQNGRITAIDEQQPATAKNITTYPNHYLVPGLIDLQVNGGGGLLFNDAATIADLHTIINAHKAFGTTGLLATLMCDTPDHLEHQLRFLAHAIATDPLCRQHILGIHLEGPFFNPERRGMHNETLIMLPNIDWMQKWLDAANNQIKIVTLAPDMPGVLDVIAYLVKRHVRVALAHSNADYDATTAATAAGATLGTHLFNTMPLLQGRAPGIVGALLANDAVSVGMINDGYHVHDASLTIALRAKGLERCFFVSDSMHALNTDQTITYRGKTLVAKDGACYTENGVFAGSAAPLLTALHRAVSHLGLSVVEAVRLCATQPAQIINLSHAGQLAVGQQANVIVLDHHLTLA